MEPVNKEGLRNATVMFPIFTSEATQLGLQNTIGCMAPLIKDFIDQASNALCGNYIFPVS